MTTLLRHTPTGELYPYNPDLARRDDMVQYTPPPEGAVESAVEVQEEEEIVVQPVKIAQPVKRTITKSKPKADELPNLDDL
jgi:hypothetical protein